MKQRKKCSKCKKEKLIEEFKERKSGRNKGYFSSYCRECNNDWNKEHFKKFPWKGTFKRIIARCTWKNGRYYQRGIKNLITENDLKFIWFRDRAYLMEKPSIDRIDSAGNYTLGNCRYIEHKENISRKKIRYRSQEVCSKVCLNCNKIFYRGKSREGYLYTIAWWNKRKFCSHICSSNFKRSK